MTKKEQMPRKDREDRERHPRDKDYNPDVTPEDKEVLNNQSKDEKYEGYFKDRQENVDFEGQELDIPRDKQKFNQTANEADDSEKNERPKDSANSNDRIESETETVYKNKDAEKYKDPSEKTRKKEQ